MRTKKNIVENVQATAEDLDWLAGEDAILALRHPNCPKALWMALAGEYPLEAMESVLYVFFLWEDPSVWQEIERENIERWIMNGIHRLPSDKERRLFAADCAERVLHLFEQEYPNDLAPRQKIDATRLYAHGKISMAQLKEASDAALITVNIAYHAPSLSASNWSAHDAAAATYDPSDAPYYAVRAAADKIEERRWQWARLQQYLRGEA